MASRTTMRSFRWTCAALAVLGLMLSFVDAQAGRQNAARVPMESFKTLYFKDGHKTMSRRSKKLPQLQCIGNSRHICDTYGPDIVLCKHLGDGAWKCEADLHHSVRFGAVDVSCEGWDGPGDAYVLRGSCLLEYTLLPNYPDRKSTKQSGMSREAVAFAVVIFAIFAYFWYKGYSQSNSNRPQTGRSGSGGGGGGDDSDAPPPPPYRRFPKPEPGTSTSSSWQPGFWTGLASGALASEATRYMRGGNDGQRHRGYYDDRFNGGGGGGNSFGPAGSSGPSRGGGGGEAETRRAYGYGGSSSR